jgi:DNA mismatch repair protein MutS
MPPANPSARPSARETPMMQQFLAAKAAHPDCIVFFRMGDFYEMFLDDAVAAAEILGITLTSRNRGAEDEIPMCGVPHHARTSYLNMLLAAGRKVAICEQVEDPKQAKGIVRREVVEVVTPGVVLDMENLEAGQNNFLVAVSQGLSIFGLAVADVSTGAFRATELQTAEDLRDELLRLEPREVLVEEGAKAVLHGLVGAATVRVTNELSPAVFQPKRAMDALKAATVLPPGETVAGERLRAAGALIAYLEENQSAGARLLQPLELYELRDHLLIDEAAKVHLELVRTLMDGKKAGSLLGVIDRSATAMGARLLRHWLLFPLLDIPRIEERLNRVEVLVGAPMERAEIRQILRDIGDLERLDSRVAADVAGPRELLALSRSLARLTPLKDALARLAPPLSTLGRTLDPLADVVGLIAAALEDEPPATLKDGGVIRRGHNAELDELIELARDGRSWLVRYEGEQRRRTGITSLKVRFNKVFGYYIEVTKANLENVPADFIRRQTLANAERFITPDLKEFEEKVLNAVERRVALEVELFAALRRAVAKHSARVRATARAVAELDVFAALAEVAHSEGYTRPRLDSSRRIDLTESRHPVVERTEEAGRFVPNDVQMAGDSARLLIITGPNMAGKSTVMRQVALIVLLGPDGLVRAGHAGRVGCRGPGVHAGGGLRQPGAWAEHVHGGDDRDGAHPQARHRPQPHPARRDRARHEHLRRPEHRLGGGRAHPRRAARAHAVCDPLPRAGRSRAHEGGGLEHAHRGQGVAR